MTKCLQKQINIDTKMVKRVSVYNNNFAVQHKEKCA